MSKALEQQTGFSNHLHVVLSAQQRPNTPVSPTSAIFVRVKKTTIRGSALMPMV